MFDGMFEFCQLSSGGSVGKHLLLNVSVYTLVSCFPMSLHLMIPLKSAETHDITLKA